MKIVAFFLACCLMFVGCSSPMDVPAEKENHIHIEDSVVNYPEYFKDFADNVINMED